MVVCLKASVLMAEDTYCVLYYIQIQSTVSVSGVWALMVILSMGAVNAYLCKPLGT